MASMTDTATRIDGDESIQHEPWCDAATHEAELFILCTGSPRRFGDGGGGWIADDGDAVRYVLVTPPIGLRLDRDLVDALLAELIAARGAM